MYGKFNYNPAGSLLLSWLKSFMADSSTGNPDSRQESILNANVSDQAAELDALGFEPYVSAIAEFLTNPVTQPPLTISIEGAWGSGKSSFMKQLQKVIEESQQKKFEDKLKNDWNNALI